MNQINEPNAGDALLIQKQAAAWLARAAQDIWSEDDQAKLDEWLASSTAHRLAYWRLNAAWERTERLAALRPTVHDRAFRPRRFRTLFAGLAAAVAAVAVYLAMNQISPIPGQKFQEFATQVGGHQLLKLADGTQIELNTDTALRIAIDANKRTVVLKRGEAYFDVRHDANRPFTVIAGSHRVIDLGTKFVVRDDLKQLRVTLVEGKARLESARAHNQALLLAPGDVATATATTMSVTRTPASIAPELSWRRGLLVFDNTSLDAVADEFNRYNKIKLVIANDTAARITIGGTFQANDVRTFAEIARTVLHLTVENRNGKIVISH